MTKTRHAALPLCSASTASCNIKPLHTHLSHAWRQGSAGSRPPVGAEQTTPAALPLACPAAGGVGCWLPAAACLTGAHSTAGSNNTQGGMTRARGWLEPASCAAFGACGETNASSKRRVPCSSRQGGYQYLDSLAGRGGQPLAASSLLQLLLLLLLAGLRSNKGMGVGVGSRPG